MIDWLTVLIALAIFTILVGFFGYLASKINMSDPLIAGKKDDNQQQVDSNNDKRKKEKNTNEQMKKKRKDQKKSKRENKDEEEQKQNEETDDEREESERESSTQVIETSGKARKRNKNKTRTATPPPSSTSTRIEGKMKDEKNSITTRAPPVTHPKSAHKDEMELTKQQTKVQVKSSQGPNKQTVHVAVPSSSSTTTNKKTTQALNVNQEVQEQPFTTVGGNRHKAGTPPLQHQQQNKSQINPTSSVVSSPVVPTQQSSVVSSPVVPTQQSSTAQVHQDPLAQRQHLSQKETPAQVNGFATNPLPLKQQTSAVPTKIADLIKVLPSSQVVVTELMSALDAFPLSTAELDIIMHKIANKQSILKQDWSKLQHGQKVDPQAHIGQVLDESARAYQEDMKTNSVKRVQELTEELNTEKRRISDLLKEKNDKEREIQILHAQFDSVQHKQQPTQLNPQQQHQIQTLQLQLQRITEENLHLNRQLTQQQQLTATSLVNNGDSSNVQVRVLSDQMKKLSVDNANLEKKVQSNESLAKEVQKEKENLVRLNEQLTQSLQTVKKDLHHNEEKLQKDSNETRTSHLNQINEYKRRIEQLESDNEQLRREEIVHVEPTNTTTDIQTITVNNEEREQFETEINELKQRNDFNQQLLEEKQREDNVLTEEIEQYKKKHDDIQTQRQSQENELRQEIKRLKENKNVEKQQVDESRNKELEAKNAQLDALRVELDEVKRKNDSTNSQLEDRLRQEQEKQRNMLTGLLSQDVRNQLPKDNQDFDQWLSSYRQIFESSVESNKRTLQEESDVLKRENDQLHKNMNDVEKQLKEIEQAVQSKEEILVDELKNKDVTLENILSENDQLTGEMQRLRTEIERLQSEYNTSNNEVRALKLQLDERFLVATNSPPVVADESFEVIKQPSPSLSPIVIDIRAEQLNELIRSSKEALETQDSVTQQLDRHLNDMRHDGTGETSVDQSTVSSSSDQQS